MRPEVKEHFRETIPAAFCVPEVGKQNPLIHTTFFSRKFFANCMENMICSQATESFQQGLNVKSSSWYCTHYPCMLREQSLLEIH